MLGNCYASWTSTEYDEFRFDLMMGSTAEAEKVSGIINKSLQNQLLHSSIFSKSFSQNYEYIKFSALKKKCNG